MVLDDLIINLSEDKKRELKQCLFFHGDIKSSHDLINILYEYIKCDNKIGLLSCLKAVKLLNNEEINSSLLKLVLEVKNEEIVNEALQVLNNEAAITDSKDYYFRIIKVLKNNPNCSTIYNGLILIYNLAKDYPCIKDNFKSEIYLDKNKYDNFINRIKNIIENMKCFKYGRSYISDETLFWSIFNKLVSICE